jgi:hypothetical protein
VINVGTYLVINKDGSVRGTATMLDSMAKRLEDQGCHLIPQAEVPSVKITFGRSTR